MARADFLHPDFVAEPYWWEAYRPDERRACRGAARGQGRDRRRRLCRARHRARIGAARGRCGRARTRRSRDRRQHAQRRLGQRRRQCRQELYRPRRRGRSGAGEPAAVRRLGRVLADRAADRGGTDRLLLAEARPVCRGLDPDAITRRRKSACTSLNDAAQSGAYMVPRERQREEIASDYYHGGMVVERSASLHPALYYKGLLDACRRRDIAICAEASVEKITRERRRLAGRDQPRRGHWPATS